MALNLSHRLAGNSFEVKCYRRFLNGVVDGDALRYEFERLKSSSTSWAETFARGAGGVCATVNAVCAIHWLSAFVVRLVLLWEQPLESCDYLIRRRGAPATVCGLVSCALFFSGWYAASRRRR